MKLHRSPTRRTYTPPYGTREHVAESQHNTLQLTYSRPIRYTDNLRDVYA